MIDAETIDGFTIGLLAANYDNPQPIPDFHREMWELCCDPHPKVAIAAPREHAKSTAITHAFVLTKVLFRDKEFVLIVSDTEGQAAEFLGDIRKELIENEALRKTFGVKRLLKDTEANIICQMADGHRFRIIAKGSEQKVRGLKWRGKRPDLIVCDDLENDEIVMNPERREKFRKWFMKALIPCGSDTCHVRVVGTILHLDSMLQRLINNRNWKHLFYEAHNPDFSEILWPEKFPKERLMAIRQDFIDEGDSEGYAQEYLNRPVEIANAFFNKDYFYDFDRENGKALLPNLEYFAAADFAISEKEKADYTVILVAGVAPDGTLYVVDAKRGRWDSERIIEELIATQKHWEPHIFTFETEKIDKAIGPFLEREMMRQRVYLNIHKETPGKSKVLRARSIQGMHKAGAIRYDKEASWYPDFESELMMVADSGPRGKHDDYFDTFAYIGKTINLYFEAQTDEEIEEERYEDEYESYMDMGRCATTGY
jgi:predicted phage terminase large subunit-like protein